MNVDSILISDFAQTHQGKLNIVGVFNKIGPTALPAQVGTMAVSLVIHGHHGEAGSVHEGEVRLIDEYREVIRTHAFEVKFVEKPEAVPGLPLRATQTILFLGQRFDRAGPYAFEVYIDDTYHASASFVVVESSE